MWGNSLVRELAVILVLKLALIYALWFAFFRPPAQEQPLTHHEVEQALLGESVRSPDSQPLEKE